MKCRCFTKFIFNTICFLVASLYASLADAACIGTSNPEFGPGQICNEPIANRECYQARDGSHWFCVDSGFATKPAPYKPASRIQWLLDLNREGSFIDVHNQGAPLSVVAAAWCLTKDNNKPIHKKSNDGTCLADKLKYGPFTEHQLGEAAMAMACGRNIPVIGQLLQITGSLNEAEVIRVCQCHNLAAQQAVLNDRERMVQALREWGGCG